MRRKRAQTDGVVTFAREDAVVLSDNRCMRARKPHGCWHGCQPPAGVPSILLTYERQGACLHGEGKQAPCGRDVWGMAFIG